MNMLVNILYMDLKMDDISVFSLFQQTSICGILWDMACESRFSVCPCQRPPVLGPGPTSLQPSGRVVAIHAWRALSFSGDPFLEAGTMVNSRVKHSKTWWCNMLELV